VSAFQKILLVDDKAENLEYLRALFTSQGSKVTVAQHGAEALIKARQDPPDLIISDLLMPVMDGYTLLRHWKADPRLRPVPFIVYTATYTEEQDEQLALNLGADAFILKPVKPDVFLELVGKVRLRVPSPQSADQPPPSEDDPALLRTYSETLIRKLEEKTLQLEETNRALQQDITERQRIEGSLRESEERFRATFELAAVGIAHVDVEGRFLRVNDKLCEITGHTREELLRCTFSDLTVPEDRQIGNEARMKVLAGHDHSYAMEKRYMRKNGEAYWVSVITTLLRDEAGAPKYFITVVSDITERRALQDQLFRAQRLESIGTLAGGIAHDLNNILAPITMGVELLRMDPRSDRASSLIENIERSARKGADLVKQVLLFARGLEGNRAAIRPKYLVREVETFINNTFPKSIRFSATTPVDIWPILGDETQLHQVLLNLCVNARDAMPAGGEIKIRLSNLEIDSQYAAMNPLLTPGRYVTIDVQDTGTGMPRHVLDRVFEPFFTTKPIGEGTGLGLSTALGIVRGHHGVIEVTSDVGQGTQFRVLLPASPDESPVNPTVYGETVPARGQGQMLLVVDDDYTVLTITQQTLEAFGYHVITADDGAQAMAQFAMNAETIALVLTDMVMPVMDGNALIPALRRLKPDLRIIITTGFTADLSRDRLHELHVTHYLAKPYSASTLLNIVQQALSSEPT
jgi:two-component system, cell cycle sensor histidine kinase and response regulator CckA